MQKLLEQGLMQHWFRWDKQILPNFLGSRVGTADFDWIFNQKLHAKSVVFAQQQAWLKTLDRLDHLD